MNATTQRPMLDTRAKTPTLAETAAQTKGLKPATSQTKPPAAAKPAKEAKPAKQAMSDADKKVIEAAKAKLAAEKQAAKEAAAAVKAEAKAKADAEKQAAKEAKAKAAAEAKAAKLAEQEAVRKEKAEARDAARAARIEAGLGDRLVPADLSHYVVNKEVKTAAGHASVNCGDALATKLMGKTLDDVYAEAAVVLAEPEADLRKKYAHLNVGMQRMNLGNRMRAAGAKQETKKAK